MYDIKRGKQTIAGCLRDDGFGEHHDCNFNFQDYQELIKARFISVDSERLCNFFQGMSRLSDNAKKVIKLVLNPPRDLEMFLISENRALTKDALQTYLRSHGWPHMVVWSTYKEISIFLKNFVEF